MSSADRDRAVDPAGGADEPPARSTVVTDDRVPDTMQTSLEVEYWVTDEAGALVEPGALFDVSPNVEPEFVEPMVELKTPPCGTWNELGREFLGLLDAVLGRADELGLRLVPLGTPVDGQSIQRRPGTRADVQERVVGRDFDCARYCAGTHLHFEQRNVVDQLNVLIALDPALALVSSSPYFGGEYVADGARSFVYRKQCYADFPAHGQLWEYVGTVAEWKRRLERGYEAFRDAALDAGVEAASVDEHFAPADAVWTPVRLREEMPTVEWRAPDAALPSQVLRLARAVEDTMERLHHTNVDVEGEHGSVSDDGIVLPEFDALRDLTERAMIDGLASPAVSGYLERMGFDVDAYDPTSRDLRSEWGDRVDADAAREIRLRYADRLERDVDRVLQEP